MAFVPGTRLGPYEIVRQVLRVCLQKAPRQRAQAVGDVRLALEGAFETSARPATAATASLRGKLVWMAAGVGDRLAA